MNTNTNVTLTGATCTMSVQDPNGTKTSYSCQVDASGKFAYYTTLGTEFTNPGLHSFQLVAVLPNGAKLISPAVQVRIGPRIL